LACRLGGNASPDVISHNIIIAAFAESGKFDDGVALLSCVHHSGLQATTNSVVPLMAAALHAARPDIALQAWEQLQLQGVHPDTNCVNLCLRALIATVRALMIAYRLLGE
jgi:pentatricopeptide repeat protein